MASMATSIKPPRTAPRTVIAYHGCSQNIAESILEEGRFLISTNAYDWLGQGIYFWEYAPYRAMNWAVERFSARGNKPAVLGATIKLGRCMNLLDLANASGLLMAYQQIAQSLGINRMPRNTDSGAHYLDREVIDSYCRMVSEENMYAYQTVRGCYPEGSPLFPGSKILSQAHVQIAVRDHACISRLHLVKMPVHH